MTFALPRRYWYKTPKGWASRPWLRTEYQEAMEICEAPWPNAEPDFATFEKMKLLYPNGIPT